MSYSPPALPPPLPRPNHGRSLSNISTSSSASSSPTKSNTSSLRTTPRNLSLSEYTIGGRLGRSHSIASVSPTKTAGASPPLSRRNSLSPTSTRRQLAQYRNSPSTSSSTPTISRPRAASIVDNFSTSPTHSRYSSLPGAGSFAKITSPPRGFGIVDIPEEKDCRTSIKQLPSPPNTSSDGASNGGGLAGSSRRRGQGSQDVPNFGNSDVFSAPPTRGSNTMRQELSPSVTASSRSGQKSTGYSPRGAKLVSGSSTPPALTARNLKTSTTFFTNALTSPDPNSSTSESETRTLRLVESRADLGLAHRDQSNGRDSEDRSARKARRSLALKEKNQQVRSMPSSTVLFWRVCELTHALT